jgi:hypothetical protein
MNRRIARWTVVCLALFAVVGGSAFAAETRVTVMWHTASLPTVSTSTDTGVARVEIDPAQGTIELINFPEEAELKVAMDTSLSVPKIEYANLTTSTTQDFYWEEGGDLVTVYPGSSEGCLDCCTALCGILWLD